jgi:hypothetical protein
MKKTTKPTTPQAGSKAATQPSMWAQLEKFMNDGDLQNFSIERQCVKHGNTFYLSAEVYDESNHDMFPKGITTEIKTSVEDCAIDLAQKLNRTADVSLQIVNAVKL